MHDVKKFYWDEPYLYRSCADEHICQCVSEVEMLSILQACRSLPVGRHHSGIWTAHKILQCGYYWPTIHQMLMSFPRHVIGAKEIEAFLRGKNSH